MTIFHFPSHLVDEAVSLTQDGQAKARLDGEVQRSHFLERGMKLRVAAGLQCDHKGERSLVESRFLQHGVNIQFVSRQDLGQSRNDAGAISHQKAQVPGSLKIAAHFGRQELLRPVRAHARLR